MAGPLQGIVVLDLSRILAGPWATQVLADFGAEVLKVEHPQGGDDTRKAIPPTIDGEAAAFLMMNRNKRGVALDLTVGSIQESLGWRAWRRRRSCAPSARRPRIPGPSDSWWRRGWAWRGST